jgi:hypothetical protein
MPFPPTPVYPRAIDSEYTLFSVRDTSEARLAADNSAWSQELQIIPVGEDEQEVWPENGYANIEGELFYYDSVGVDGNGKVNRLRGCARQLGGEDTKFNRKGTWVRGFVVAEQHNQLVEAMLKTQDFVGYDFDPRPVTLDWRIRNLQALDVIFDDYSCPDVNFTLNTLEDDPVKGVLIEYAVEITPPGSISSFRLDFGDGEFTISALSGQHRYAINARIDPVVRVSNDKCQIVQTPIERDNPSEPEQENSNNFDVAVPEVPDVPDFTFVPCEVPEPDITVPPLMIPCISIEGQVGPIPSVITGPTINMVSQVTITSNNPINITQSIISIVGGNIPGIIIVDPPIPPTIIVDPPIPPTIVIVPPQSNITVDLDFTQLPRLEVDWGMPPEMEVALTMARAVRTPQKFAVDASLVEEFGTEFADLFDVSQKMNVTYEAAGIPSEIMIIAPDLQDIKIDTDDLFKRKIQIDANSVNIPTDIKIHGPDSPIPDSIKFDVSDLNEAINNLRDINIKVDFSETPKTIKVETDGKIPERIMVEMAQPIPTTIVIKHDLPNSIELIAPLSIPLSLPPDLVIPLKFPEIMPEVPLVFRGGPIELKVTMDDVVTKSEDGKNCFMLVPCGKG